MSTGLRHHHHHNRTHDKDLLWKAYFRSPSEWWDNRRSKASPVTPDFKHKTTKDSLWIDGLHNPSWVREELSRRDLTAQARDGELCLETEKSEKVIHVLNQQEKVITGKLCLEKKKSEKVIHVPDSQQALVAGNTAFLPLLRACAKKKDLHRGTRVHADILKCGLLEKSSYVANTLVNMYAKCGNLVKAHRMLEELPFRNVVSWSALIAGYTQQGQGHNALDCFQQMQCGGLSPDAVTFTCILKACGSIGAVDKGERIHHEIARQGLLGKDLVLGNALVDMYAKCGAFAKARKVLEKLPVRDVVSWSALIAGYTQHGQGQEALSCFVQMQREGLLPDAVTFVSILKACGSIGALDKGEQIHEEIARQGLLKNKIVLGNALVDMYAKCNALPQARRVLEELPARDVISWNALIAGYAEHGQGEEALSCYECMQHEGLTPNAVTYICILKACSSLGSVDKGKQIHDEIVRRGLLGNDVVLGTALVDMYAKCGALAKAQHLLEELPVGDVIFWSSLIAGYAQQGQYQDALNCFDRMQHKGFSPDGVTLSCVLNACSHSGLVDKGQTYFANMSATYGVTPNFEHYTCMVDLYGRAGHFDKAKAVIQRMPSLDCPTVWYVLLGACQKWGDVNVGKWAFEHALQLDKGDGATYVCMANIYAVAGMHKEAENIKALRKKNNPQKKPECNWWIDMNGTIDLFSAMPRVLLRSSSGPRPLMKNRMRLSNYQ